MRITSRILINNFIQGFTKNQTQIAKIQESIASGKRINRPSDDPVGITQVLSYKRTLESLGQYKRNIDQGKNWLNITSTALTNLKNLVVRANEIAIAQASSTADDFSRDVAAQEIQVIFDQVAQLANTKLDNRYIFGGYKTNTAPFDSSGAYSGDDGEIKVEISPDVSVVVNISGNRVFKGSGGGKDIFTILSDLKTALENDNSTGIAAQLGELNSALEQVIREISYAGAKINQLETTRERTLDFETEFTLLLSGTEDMDMAKAITELNAKQLAYEASLAAAKRVILQSLVDFLR
ncbi:MAG: flagellar hook-associated protein 3 [Nitrospinae bacterium RIFCSPLOWO2_12_FULL_45_22]|nr:MAG: flagellar hook-associated protein 3 [Nitrospinae bacterium RIFCSPLOWO2_12_FULL_45_22]